MTDYEPFSRRQQQRVQDEQPLELEYSYLPREFRVQAYTILDDIIGDIRETGYVSSGYIISSPGRNAPTPYKLWDTIHDLIAREYGVFNLCESGGGSRRQGIPKQDQFRIYLVDDSSVSTPHLLDAIEIAFHVVHIAAEYISSYQGRFASRLTPEQGIEELNRRFRQHNLGYEFDPEGDLIIRVDSRFLHVETVVPSLILLRRAGFEGAEAEFQRAREHHRHGRHEEAMADALKSFESTMKYICDRRGWAYDPDRDTAKRLIEIVLQEGLVPSWVQSEFTALRTMLESGLPTARNRAAGHGRGAIPRQIPSYLSAFALHMAASNIVLLVEAFNELPAAGSS